jgi:hypothetical protein
MRGSNPRPRACEAKATRQPSPIGAEFTRGVPHRASGRWQAPASTVTGIVTMLARSPGYVAGEREPGAISRSIKAMSCSGVKGLVRNGTGGSSNPRARSSS